MAERFCSVAISQCISGTILLVCWYNGYLPAPVVGIFIDFGTSSLVRVYYRRYGVGDSDYGGQHDKGISK